MAKLLLLRLVQQQQQYAHLHIHTYIHQEQQKKAFKKEIAAAALSTFIPELACLSLCLPVCVLNE